MHFHFSKLTLAAGFLLGSLSNLLAGESKVDFAREVLPVLSENCFHCHGPDEKSRKAKLRLDTQEGAFRKDNPALIAGKSAESELIKRLISTDPEEVMPPPKSNRKLTPAQIELLKRWVDQGAPWGTHWAFQTPKTPELPAVKEEKWARTPLDKFILARLEKEGLKPNADSKKEALIRKVTLDLTGLPPTLEEVDAFLADNSPDAYEKVVDRLFKSVHYGERMAWDWLDAARYSDTNGYQGDGERTMWPWRDWVVRAFNANQPYDKFTIEQLAGDLLPNATLEQKLATGFNRNHPINGEGGRIPAENRVEYVMDQTETTSAVWLGVTMTCARCHDHKYDPFKQKEYYSLYGFFNQTPVEGGGGNGQTAPVVEMGSQEQIAKGKELRDLETAAQKERDELEKKLKSEQAAWEKMILDSTAGGTKAHEIKWVELEPEGYRADSMATLAKQPDNSILVSGDNPQRDVFVVTSKVHDKNITAIKLDALTDTSLTANGPGRANNGNFVLSEIQMQGDGLPVQLGFMSADFEQQGWPAANAIDGRDDTGWGVQPQLGKPHWAIFETLSQVGQSNEPTISVRLEFKSSNLRHVMGRFKISYTTDARELLRSMPQKVRDVLAIAADKRNDAQKKELADYYLNTHGSLSVMKKKYEDAKNARTKYEKSLPRVMVMADGKARETFVLVRGAYDKPAEKVELGTPSCLPPMTPEMPKNRLGLAQWLVSANHPLTARVTVNRIWQQFFGTGIVKTAEDFGVQSEKPSHPELLDWMATEFIRTGWDVKALQRMIVTSSAYRQSSKSTAEVNERDPENRLLAHGPRRRLPAWMLRDQALFLSGLMVDKQGGPPVKPYQPPGLWEEATFGTIKYVQDHGEALYRRSLYVFWRRILGPTEFFDNSPRQTCSLKPYLTNTPLHALTTLNSITYIEAARALAQRVIKQGGADASSRIAYVFRLATSRKPEPAEVAILSARLEKLRADFSANPDAAKKLLAMGESKRDDSLDVAEHAAYTALCTLILNLDETLNKE